MHKQKPQRYSVGNLIFSISILAWFSFTHIALAGSPHKTSHHGVNSKAVHNPEPIETTPALRISDSPNLKGLIPELAKNRIIFIGEIHTRYDHHLTQLEIIRRLHALYPDLVIGMESFQQPF